jgi:predicted transcriptional regulator
MPEKGFASITVPDEILKRLRKIAEKEKRTIPAEIEDLIEIYEGGQKVPAQ